MRTKRRYVICLYDVINPLQWGSVLLGYCERKNIFNIFFIQIFLPGPEIFHVAYKTDRARQCERKKREDKANEASSVGLRENESTVVCEHSRWGDVWWWWCSCCEHSGLTAVVRAGLVLSAVTVKHTDWNHTGFRITVCVRVCVCVTGTESDAPSECQLISSSHTTVKTEKP